MSENFLYLKYPRTLPVPLRSTCEICLFFFQSTFSFHPFFSLLPFWLVLPDLPLPLLLRTVDLGPQSLVFPQNSVPAPQLCHLNFTYLALTIRIFWRTEFGSSGARSKEKRLVSLRVGLLPLSNSS